MSVPINKTSQTKTLHVRVAVIGSGFSGLGTAIRLKESGENDFVVLEKESGLGGTWQVNHYPGCACDVPSHLYSFSFEKSPYWNRMYASQPEILAYLEHCADKYGVRPHIQFDSEVTQATYDEANTRWHIETADGRSVYAQVVVSGIGGLSRPAWPDAPGLENFKGKTFHSQQWDHDYDLKGKRVAVIGTGASAIQFVPQIAKDVDQLHLFQRTAPWVLPKPDWKLVKPVQSVMAKMPQTMTALRGIIYAAQESQAVAFTINPSLLKAGQFLGKRHIQLRIKDPALRRKVTPNYLLGCKRVLLSNDYYPALTRDNVEVLTTGLQEVRANSVIGSDGSEREVDAIIFGTGFAATDPVGPLKITGRDGLDLKQEFQRTGTEAYLGTTVAGFPNLFLVMGPNTGLGHNSMVYMIESQINYILKALQTMQQRRLQSIEVRESVQNGYNAMLQSKQDDTVWATGGCKSWYLDETGKNVTLWPGFTWQFRRLTNQFRALDYQIKRNPIPRKTITRAAA
ncbi:MAG: NAD(P)/FAD-dependent oxidoreductase [Salinisphaeraceae bacterium]|nr:NAD(P)/FAD-dependent oxidoreductase [Salinisphaeraceae bacterium]